MALNAVNNLGPEINQMVYGLGTGYSVVATTTDDAASPPQGTYWLKKGDTGGSTTKLPDTTLATNKNYYWLVCRGLRLEGTIGTGTVGLHGISEDLGNFLTLNAIGQVAGGTTYKLQLKSGAGNVGSASTTIFNDSTTYDVRVEWDNAANEITVWVNGTSEIVASHSLMPAKTEITFRGVNVTGVSAYFRSIGFFWGDDDTTDRPGTAAEVLLHTPNAQGTYNDYTGITEITNKYLNWDDWAGGGTSEGTTSYNSIGSGGGTQSSAMTTSTYTNVIYGVGYYANARINVASKFLIHTALIVNGTNIGSAKLPDMTSTSFANFIHFFGSAPGVGTFSQAIIDDLEQGHIREPAGGTEEGANAEVSAIALEGIAVPFDLPGTGTVTFSLGYKTLMGVGQ